MVVFVGDTSAESNGPQLQAQNPRLYQPYCWIRNWLQRQEKQSHVKAVKKNIIKRSNVHTPEMKSIKYTLEVFGSLRSIELWYLSFTFWALELFLPWSFGSCWLQLVETHFNWPLSFGNLSTTLSSTAYTLKTHITKLPKSKNGSKIPFNVLRRFR